MYHSIQLLQMFVYRMTLSICAQRARTATCLCFIKPFKCISAKQKSRQYNCCEDRPSDAWHNRAHPTKTGRGILRVTLEHDPTGPSRDPTYSTHGTRICKGLRLATVFPSEGSISDSSHSWTFEIYQNIKFSVWHGSFSTTVALKMILFLFLFYLLQRSS